MRISTLFFAAAAALTANVAMAAMPAYTLTPAAGVATDLQGIVLAFPNDVVTFAENNKAPIAVLENLTSGKEYVCQDADRNTKAEAAAAYTLTFADADGVVSEDPADDSSNVPACINEPGSYLLTIRYMELNDEVLEPITANYTIEYPVAYTLNPAPGVANNLQDIVLTFTTAKVAFYENNQMPVAVLENLTTGVEYVCQVADRNTFAETDGTQYTLKFVDTDGEEDVALPVINQPGEYLLTVRAMYVGELGEETTLPVLTAKYTVEYPVPFALTPAAGVATDLTTITLDFTANNNVAFYENNRMAVAVLENLTSGKIYVCDEAVRDTRAQSNGAAYTLQFVNEDYVASEDPEATPESVTEPGIYRLTVRGLYIEEGEDMIDLPNIVETYTIVYPYDYTLTPAANSTVTDLQGVVITFDEVKVGFYENNRMPVAVLENVNTGTTYVCYEPDLNDRAQTDGNSYTFMFLEEDSEEPYAPATISEIGEYLLTIKGMYVEGANGDYIDLPVITVKYSIAYPYTYILDPANEATVSQIQFVNLEFPNNKNIEFVENTSRNAAVLTFGTATGDDEVAYFCAEPTRETFVESDGVVYTFAFTDYDGNGVIIDEGGWYYLAINGFATVDENGEYDEFLPTITAAYYVDSESSKVTKIETVEGVFNVFNINGVQIVRNGNASSLNNLPAGLYIINGKKVMVK